MAGTGNPNIILICSDQHRAEAMGAYGNPVCRTPALDGLAASGVRMERCFSQNPVCMPARASMLTGLLGRKSGVLRNGQPLRRGTPTLADLLAARGYGTAAVGKLHLTPQSEGVPEAPYYGFARVDSVEDHTVGPYLDWALREFPEHEGYLLGTLFNLPSNEAYWEGRRDLRQEYLAAREKYVTPLEISRTCNWGFGHYSPLPEEAHKNSWITARAVDCLERRDRERPLFLWVGYVDPHNPFDPPRRFREMYDPGCVDAPRRRPDEEETGWAPHHLALYERYFREFTDLDWRTLRALYYASVTFMDDQIGRLLAAVERSLDMANTLVLYTSDHGEILGDHGICGKSAYHYDSCIRVPLIARWDGRWARGARQAGIVEQTDLAATLLEAAGLAVPEGGDGRSFEPLLRGASLPGARGHAYAESFTGAPEDPTPAPLTWARTIRTDRWRATFYPGVRTGELYDLQDDPGEFRNRWADPACREIVEEHRRLLLDRLILMDYPIVRPRYGV